MIGTLRCCLVSLALSSLFATSLVHADDCSDGLMAESCACMSGTKSEPRISKGSGHSARPGRGLTRENPGKKSAKAGRHPKLGGADPAQLGTSNLAAQVGQ